MTIAQFKAQLDALGLPDDAEILVEDCHCGSDIAIIRVEETVSSLGHEGEVEEINNGHFQIQVPAAGIIIDEAAYEKILEMGVEMGRDLELGYHSG